MLKNYDWSVLRPAGQFLKGFNIRNSHKAFSLYPLFSEIRLILAYWIELNNAGH